jgi:hypothetical protein
VSIEEQHVALPKLYGAPAYARPPAPVDPKARPFDPDQLPIAADQTDEERRIAALMPAHSYSAAERDQGNRTTRGSRDLRPRLFRMRSIAGRLLRSDRLVGEGGLEPPTSEV